MKKITAIWKRFFVFCIYLTLVAALGGVIFESQEAIPSWYKAFAIVLGIILIFCRKEKKEGLKDSKTKNTAPKKGLFPKALTQFDSIEFNAEEKDQLAATSYETYRLRMKKAENIAYSKVPISTEIINKDFSNLILTEELKWRIEQSAKAGNILAPIDRLMQSDFVVWCKDLLLSFGFDSIEILTDNNYIDFVADKHSVKYAFKCLNDIQTRVNKNIIKNVAVGKLKHNCIIGVVVSTSSFTEGSIEAARNSDIKLWDRTTLEAMVRELYKIEANTEDKLN